MQKPRTFSFHRAVDDHRFRSGAGINDLRGGDFYWVPDNSWQENTVNWNTEPAADPTLRASLGAFSVNTWHEVDLSSLVTGDGTYSIRIATTSSNGADFSTKEGAAGFGPQLVVAFVQ